MSYIGSSAAPLPVAFAAAQADSFSGTGSQSTFTLSRFVTRNIDIEVIVNNVQQSPYDGSYSLVGNSLIFSESPSAGTNNIYVIYRDQPIASIAPPLGSVTPSRLSTGGPSWDTSGNFGIGTTSPSNYAGYGTITLNGSSGGEIDFKVGNTLYADMYANTTGLFIRAQQSTPLMFWAGGSERARIDANGNMLIGATSQAYDTVGYRLGIQSGGSQTYIGIAKSGQTLGSGGMIIGLDTSDAYVMVREAINLRFGTSNLIRATIDSGGNLLVGTSTANGKLTVNSGTAAFNASTIFMQNSWSGDVGYAGLYLVKNDNNTTTSQILVRFAINGNAVGQGQINANGANACAFGSFSDARLKQNIVDLPSQLDSIMALRPVEFDYIESEGGGHQIGFVAQEMQEVYPDAVGTRQPDEMLTVTGWSKTEARLVKAIQEQQALINQLTQRITALEGN